MNRNLGVSLSLFLVVACSSPNAPREQELDSLFQQLHQQSIDSSLTELEYLLAQFQRTDDYAGLSQTSRLLSIYYLNVDRSRAQQYAEQAYRYAALSDQPNHQFNALIQRYYVTQDKNILSLAEQVASGSYQSNLLAYLQKRPSDIVILTDASVLKRSYSQYWLGKLTDNETLVKGAYKGFLSLGIVEAIIDSHFTLAEIYYKKQRSDLAKEHSLRAYEIATASSLEHLAASIQSWRADTKIDR